MERDDRIIIHWVGVGILACGILMLISPTYGRIALNFIFLIYMLIRVSYYRKIWKKPFTASDKQRLVLLVVLGLCVLLNFSAISENYFLPVFLITLEYLSIVNRERMLQNPKE
jgi:hypothetical protein